MDKFERQALKECMDESSLLARIEGGEPHDYPPEEPPHTDCVLEHLACRYLDADGFCIAISCPLRALLGDDNA